MLVGMVFPTAGCWEVRGTYRGSQELTVVMRRLTMAMQLTPKSVTQIASAISAPACPAADRRR
jgi:hypothetical protein